MARCEDFPCCGHAYGECPQYDKHGRIVPRCVTCQKKLSPREGSSLCRACYRYMLRRDEYGYGE